MTHMEQIFVYGTLRPPRLDTPAEDSRYYPQIAPFIQVSTPACLVDALLFDLGSYPAIQPGEGVVYGDLLTVKPPALKITDRIEGHPNFYQRRRVPVETEHETITAWTYWAPEALTHGMRRLVCGDWFLRRQKDCYEESPGVANDSQIAQAEVDETLQSLIHRFAEAKCSWFSSTRPDGRAHNAPIWHVWYQGRIYVVTTSKAIRTANIGHNPGVVITHPDPVDPVIIEGWATLALETRQTLQPLFKAKYDWDISTSPDYDIILEIVPLKLIAWGKYGEGRWRSSQIMQIRLPSNP